METNLLCSTVRKEVYTVWHMITIYWGCLTWKFQILNINSSKYNEVNRSLTICLKIFSKRPAVSQGSPAKRFEGIFLIIIPLLDCFKGPKPADRDLWTFLHVLIPTVLALMVSFSPECTPKTRSLVRASFKFNLKVRGESLAKVWLSLFSVLIYPSVTCFFLHIWHFSADRRNAFDFM